MSIAVVLSVTGQAWARDAEGNLRELRPGDVLQEGEVVVTPDGGDPVDGTVRLAAAQIDRKTQFGHVRISAKDAAALRLGLFVRVTIDARRSCGVSIPRSAIDRSSVQVVKDAIVETRKVKTGLVSAGAIEILDGLREGDIVIADAGTSLHDGDLIKPTFLDETDRSRAR